MLVIKRLEPYDAADYRALRLQALKLHPECFGASFLYESAQPLAFFKGRIANNVMIGAFLSDELVGMAGLRSENSDKTGHIAHIISVYVQAKARGNSIARELMLELLNMAKDYRSIRLSVTADNDAAYRLYKSLGFRAWATDRAALKVSDIYYDEILMRLDR